MVGGDRLLGVALPELGQGVERPLMCGVLGICAPDRDVARLAHFGLHALQHRGQESAGIAVSDGGHLTVLREMGLVAQVFSEQKLSGLRGQLAIGHTRYSTTGSAPVVERAADRPARTQRARSRSGTTATSSTRASCATSWRRTA